MFKPDWCPDVTRIEVIDAKGRSYSNWRVRDMEFSLQDDNKTLKIFLRERPSDDE